MDDRRGPDLVQVVPAGALDRGVADRDEGEQALAVDHVVDEPERALLPDREGRHRVGKDDRLLERQDGQLGRKLADFSRVRERSSRFEAFEVPGHDAGVPGATWPQASRRVLQRA